MHAQTGAQMLLDRLGWRLTLGGSAMATASGATAAAVETPSIISMADWGAAAGIVFAAIGITIQIVRWLDERKVTKAELELIAQRAAQEAAEHAERMRTGQLERRKG